MKRLKKFLNEEIVTKKKVKNLLFNEVLSSLIVALIIVFVMYLSATSMKLILQQMIDEGLFEKVLIYIGIEFFVIISLISVGFKMLIISFSIDSDDKIKHKNEKKKK